MGIYTGLDEKQVLESRQKNGVNQYSPVKRQPAWKAFVQTLTGPFGHCIEGWKDGDSLVFILEIAAILSVLVSTVEFMGIWGLSKRGADVFFEPVGIIMAIILATAISFYFELKASKEFSVLNQVNDDESIKVWRDSSVTEVPKKDIVVGDVMIISAGDEIAADAELLEAVCLQVDESSLTGELTCSKTADVAQLDADATYPSNHVLKGTKVMEGHGVARVFAVGDHSQSGKVFKEAQIDDTVRTPLNIQLDRLGKWITWISYAVAAAVFIMRMAMFLATEPEAQTIDVVTYALQSLMIVVTLIVVAVPEGLPMAVSLSLAYSMRRMLKTNNLVRKMHACETMGAATVICTDKTGTLTKNEMHVSECYFPGGMEQLARENMAVNCTANIETSSGQRKVIGNPTEGALLLWLDDNGTDYLGIQQEIRRIGEIPFSTERKFMATAVISSLSSNPILYVKGAPEIVMSMCPSMDEALRKDVQDRLLAYQQRGMRTLGFAYREMAGLSDSLDTGDMTFLGVVAISDPVREDVPKAVRECLDAGIRVKIVTGDTSATAIEIGRQIGLWTEGDDDRNVLTGPQVAQMSDKELEEAIGNIKIVSRARPQDKRRLVEALQRTGQVVAVTGDGTNDAPALKAAHVGLSMGDGTSVAKEASDITIIDNSFASIGRAVMWGRSLYHNIQKFILFQSTVNVVACLVVLCGAFLGTDSPLTVTQMLWVNLIMDTFAAMALSSLPPSESVMREVPRDRKSFIVSGKMAADIFSVGGLFFILLLGFLVILERHDISSMKDLLSFASLPQSSGLTAYELSIFFTFFVMLQFFNMFNVKAFSSNETALHMKGCKGFISIAWVILLGQIAIVSIGGQFFNVVPLPAADWIVIILLTSVVLWLGEISRFIGRKL